MDSSGRPPPARELVLVNGVWVPGALMVLLDRKVAPDFEFSPS